MQVAFVKIDPLYLNDHKVSRFFNSKLFIWVPIYMKLKYKKKAYGAIANTYTEILPIKMTSTDPRITL